MKIANVDGDVKRVAVVFEDHTLAINLYTGKDYVEYAQDTRRFSPYKANLMATYVKIPFAVAKDPEKGCYCICMQVDGDKSKHILFEVDEIYCIVNDCISRYNGQIDCCTIKQD